ncbi:hypothetical protein GCM10010156_60630 [Planobispora rosea]|uniref:Uncharacterized protein n=1 Tax=Planobispora rosea TaxID=35762 RepID=A0A8J3SCR1_PLARO|nr:hypothetical protein [Planobispora rosea]GGS94225.1 hypothetical protein GCM10010156_60630 [Planobispora rosea]GIH87343.1 hypothetical protein Pro02_57510 [Planobispora rosea]
MWFLDKTARQLRSNPCLLTFRPPEPGRLESLLRQYDPALKVSGDWFVVRDAKVRWTEVTEGVAAKAGIPADRRGAIVADGDKDAARFVLNALASRIGGALYPPEIQDDYVDVQVNLGAKRGVLDCEEVAELVRSVLGERTVRHDHELGLCSFEGGPGSVVKASYSWPTSDLMDPEDHVIDLELDARDLANHPGLELLYRTAVSLAAALDATVTSYDMPVTRLEDIIPTQDRLPA